MQKMTCCLLTLALLSFASGLHGGGATPWYFLPTFNTEIRGLQHDVSANPHGFHESLPRVVSEFQWSDNGLSRVERQFVRWHTAEFPHEDFVRLMPQRDVHGWYAHAFDIPRMFRGMDLVIDLGVIDDADETFLNGSQLGKTGKIPGGSAWRTDRLYRASATRLRDEGNIVAVHVWSQWGLGGIVGPPVIKAAVAPVDAEWELATIKEGNAPLCGLNAAITTASALSVCFPDSHVEWQTVSVPWKDHAALPDDVHWMVFRLRFDLFHEDGSPRRFAKPLVMDCGPVFDVAAFFLNGRRVGLVGRFPEDGLPAFTEAAQRARFIVDPKNWAKDGRNELLAVVFRELGIGGLPGVPGLLPESPLDSKAAMSVAAATDLFTLHFQSGQTAKAARILKKTKAGNGADRAWQLSHHAHLAFLQWLDGGRKDIRLLDDVLAQIAEILSKLPAEAPKQSAMQAFCRILRMAEEDDNIMKLVRRRFPRFLPDGPSFPPDRLTQGDWARAYGTAVWAFGAMGQKQDLYNRPIPPLGYKLSVPGGRDAPRLWLPQSQFNLSDRHALSLPDGNEFFRSMASVASLPTLHGGRRGFPLDKGRASSWWDDHGEMHPFDDCGPDLVLELPDIASVIKRMPPKPAKFQLDSPFFTITLHHQDFDWRETLHPRQQSVIMTDMDGSLLDAVWLGKTDKGVYQTFHARRDRPVRFRSIKHRSACVALSGFLADVPPPLPPRPDTLPDRDLHPLALVASLPDTLQNAASEFLAAVPGPRRTAAARAYLSLESDGGNTASPVARAVLLAFTADAAFDFDARLPLFTHLLDAMRPEDMRMLVHHLSAARCHHRWTFITGVRLLEAIEGLPPPQAARLLRVFDSLGPDYRLRPLREAARELAIRKYPPEKQPSSPAINSRRNVPTMPQRP